MRVLKIDANTILWNFEPFEVDEEGNQIWNIPQDVSQLKQMIADTLIWLEKQRLSQICDQYGYNGLADITYYANQNDTEAQALLSWYQTYDDAIWNWIDIQLPNHTTLDSLLSLDMQAVEEQIFQQATQEAPLP